MAFSFVKLQQTLSRILNFLEHMIPTQNETDKHLHFFHKRSVRKELFSEEHCDGISGKMRHSNEGTEQDYLPSARVSLKQFSSYDQNISFPGVHPVAEGQQYESCGDFSES